ncbi:MAG: tetratricopeptide repeat protein [bacterium]|nr:tetratricopeptide repeat protein [bacterium]
MTYEIIPQLAIILGLAGIIVILGRKIPQTRELKIEMPAASLSLREKTGTALKKVPRYGLAAIIGGGKKLRQAASFSFNLARRGILFLGRKIKMAKEKAEEKRRAKKAAQIQAASPVPAEEAGAQRLAEAKKEIYFKPLAKRKERKAAARLDLEELLRQAQNYVRLGRLEEAEKICFAIIRRNSKNAQVYKILGNLYFAKDNFPDAENSFREALKRGIDEIDVYKKLGLAYTEEGRIKEAEKIYHRALKNKKAKEYFYLELGKMYRNQNNASAALKIYEDLAREYPGNYQYVELLEKQKKAGSEPR